MSVAGSLDSASVLIPVQLQFVLDAAATPITADSLEHAFDVRCDGLTVNQKEARRQTEMRDYALLALSPHERDMKGPTDTSQAAWIAFKANYIQYRRLKGQRDFLSWVRHLHQQLIGKLRRTHQNDTFPITTFDGTNQRFLHAALWYLFDDASVSTTSNIKDAFSSLKMPGTFFCELELDNYIGSHLQIAEDYEVQYATLSNKEQVKYLLDPLVPKAMQAALWEQRDRFDSPDEVLAAIGVEAGKYSIWAAIEKRDHGRLYTHGVQTSIAQSITKKLPPPPTGKDNMTPEEQDAKKAIEAKRRTARKARQQSAHKVDVKDDRCTNCGNQNKVHLALDICDVACRHPKCKAHPRHFVDQCKTFVKKAKAVTIIHEDEMEVTNMKIRQLPVLAMKPSKPSSSVSTSITSENYLEGSRRRELEDVRIIFDTGATHMMSPVKLDDSNLLPSASTLVTATGGIACIEGSQLFGSTDVSICSELDECLVNQQFIEDNNCSTFLCDNRLFILSEQSTKLLTNALASIPAEQYITIDKSNDNLYDLTTDILHKIKAPSLHVAPEHHHAFIARYHTVQFANLKELVLYWHNIFRHASMDEMIRIVHNKVIQNLPAQLSEEVIRRHFPALPKNPPCLDCALGSIALRSSPPASPTIQASPHPSIDDAIASMQIEIKRDMAQSASLNDRIQQMQLSLSQLLGPSTLPECPLLVPPLPVPTMTTPIISIVTDQPTHMLHRQRGMSPINVSIDDEDLLDIGAYWQADDKTFMGDTSHANSIPVIAIGGYTHTFSAIDKVSGRVFGRPTKGTANSVSQFLWVFEQNKSAGHTMKTWSIDKGKLSNDLKIACTERQVKLSVAIPDEHWGIGGIERWHKTIHEGIIKKCISNPNITPNMWALAYNDDKDMYNCLPTSRHLTKSPYQLFDKKVIDARLSPMLPFGSIVVAQIPLSKQTLQTGRGIELIVVGRYDDGYEGILCFNLITKRTFARRSIKFMGDHPIKGLLFSTPIILEDPLSIDEYDDIVSDIPIILDAAKSADNVFDDNANVLQYSERLSKADLHAAQKKFTTSIGSTFAENIADKVTSLWKIHGIVRELHSRQIFFQYYDMTQPLPSTPDDFEYTPCAELLKADWANFKHGATYAKAIKNNKGLPSSYDALIRMTNITLRDGLIAALHSECASYWENDVVGITSPPFDWSTLNPKDIGDLMLIFSVKTNADGSHDKYKCRIVFRGDRWNNVNSLSTYSSSAESDAINLLVATAASEGLDIFSADVKTAFLYGRFPDGMIQYVRSPRGLPENLLPRKFRLKRCAYGHPLAGVQWEEHSNKTLFALGFKQNISSASTFTLNKNGESIIVARVTDDLMFICKYGCTLKEWVLSELAKIYTITIRDPLTSYVGLHITRDFDKCTATLTQPKHIDGMASKYPNSHPLHKFPTTPMLPKPHTMSYVDKELSAVPLTPKRLTDYQQILGDISWVAHKTRPDVLFSLNTLARKVTYATELDYKHADRIAQYIIGTKQLGLILGSKHGTRLIACVDSSYAIHDDSKSHSSWDIHIGTGASSISRTKKQSITTDSSTFSELVGAHMSIKDIMWCRTFLSEIGYPQRSATTLFIDNQSTLKIIENKCNSGKTRWIDIRYNLIRELIAAGEIKVSYLATDHMIADMNTKVLSSGPFLFLRNFLLGSSSLAEFNKVFA
jgi:hypothetical protein